MSLEGIVLKMEDIKVGDVHFSKTVTEADIMMFAQLSTLRPSASAQSLAKTMMYKSRIAHGMLIAGLICPVLNRLCGRRFCYLLPESSSNPRCC